jgi:hypothetical protein
LSEGLLDDQSLPDLLEVRPRVSTFGVDDAVFEGRAEFCRAELDL